MPPGLRGPPPGAHSGPEPSWSPQRRTGVTACLGPGTQWPSRPERWLACGTWEGGRVRGHWPQSQRQISLARLRPRPPPRPLPVRAGDRHSPRPEPYPTHPVRPHLLPTTDSRRTSTSPGASGRHQGQQAQPLRREGRGWEASGGPWWKRREVATAAKRSAPGAGGGGPKRAWAGGAGSRGLCRGAEQA